MGLARNSNLLKTIVGLDPLEGFTGGRRDEHAHM